MIGLKKTWICASCGHQFETPWIPHQFVSCPRCGSRLVYRADPRRGRGFGPRFARGICPPGWGARWQSQSSTQQQS